VLNLADNVIKYSGEGIEVTISVGRSGADATISVTDDGPGIEPEALVRIFDRFYRVDTGRSRREGGTGLGLAIVKELIESLGGKVEARSVVGEGSTFTVTLPAAAPASPAPRPNAMTPDVSISLPAQQG
jgi:two-component system phosphate regulon sensor histidine kinase PhoR